MITIACIIPSSCSKTVLPHLQQCIESLKISSKGCVHSFIVVVSAATTAKTLTQKLPIDKLVLVNAGDGFGVMNNKAIDEVIQKYTYDYFLLINDDMTVQKNFFKNFLLTISGKQYNLINPIVYKKGSHIIDSYGVEYFTSGYAKNNIFKDVQTTLVTAGCLFIKTTLLKKMKKIYGFYFNPLFFYYAEDVEFSIRALALGATIAKTNSLIAEHVGSFSSKEKSDFVIYHTYRNLLWTILITWPIKIIIQHVPKVLIVQIWMIVYTTVSGHIFLYPKIILDTIKNVSKILRYRKKVLVHYKKNFEFEDVFSQHMFRTKYGHTI